MSEVLAQLEKKGDNIELNYIFVQSGGGSATITCKNAYLFLEANSTPNLTVDGVTVVPTQDQPANNARWWQLSDLTNATLVWDRGRGLLCWI